MGIPEDVVRPRMPLGNRDRICFSVSRSGTGYPLMKWDMDERVNEKRKRRRYQK